MLHLLFPENAYKLYSKPGSYFRSGGGDCVYETQLCKTTVKLSITANNINRQISKKLTGHLRIYFLEPLQGWGKK